MGLTWGEKKVGTIRREAFGRISVTRNMKPYSKVQKKNDQ